MCQPPRRALLVIAHPDDESLFFANYLSNAARIGLEVYVLCLSSGNADGLGRVRAKELVRACTVLKIDSARISIVDDPALQDGFHTWDSQAIVRHVAAAVESIQPDELVTFDCRGVSGHPNHTSIYHAVRHMVEAGGSGIGGQRGGVDGPEPGAQFCRVYVLVTHPLPYKFTGPLGAALSLLPLSGSCGDVVFLTRNPLLTFRAMCCHWSQFVWYRLLFVLFSTYTYASSLRPLGTLAPTAAGSKRQQ